MVEWQRSGPEPGQDYPDVLSGSAESIAKITINRPEVCHAFRPTTLFEPSPAFTIARGAPKIGVTILTGTGEESQEGRNAYQEKRKPDSLRFPRRP